ncbi:MAG: hypothetical protein AAGC56_00650 [Pseudomonadota bacterium]
MRQDEVTLNDAVEDLFGLSFRAIATVRALIVRPAEYYAAARVKDWEGRFTPSMRMWLSLFALLSLLQFIWLGPDSPMVAATATSVDDAGLDLPAGMTAEQLSEKIYVTVYAAFPVVALCGLTLGGLLFPFWGKGQTAGTRLRSTFATVIPSTFMSVALTTLTVVLSRDQLGPLPLAALFIAALLDFVTAARGAFPGSHAFLRVLRALVLAAWIGGINFAVSIASQFAGFAVVTVQTGVPLVFRGG